MTSRRVIGTYLTTSVLFTLAVSVIWGVNTLFLMGAGLTIFEVMLVNAAFTAGQVVFEVPTGVIADTIGRKASFLLASAVIFVSTLLYVAAAQYTLSIWWFVVASVLLGFGFSCQTGAVDAWLVDALDYTGFDQPKERVFSWGGIAFGSAMLVGTLAGGFLGQVNLAFPYVARAGLLVVTFVVTAVMMRDLGFEPRPLRLSNFGAETKTIFDAGIAYGWRHPVVRPLMWASFAFGLFFIYAFYSMQRFALDLLGHEYVWVIGVLTASASLASIGGNALVKMVMRDGERRRDPARVLAAATAAIAILSAGIGLIGLLTANPGIVPFLIVSLLWLGWNLMFGLLGPIRQAFINAQIPSSQRATVLSLDAFFGDVGGSLGQPGLGWLSGQHSIPVGWLVGALCVGAAVPLYAQAGKAASELAE
jgi:MFS family permease